MTFIFAFFHPQKNKIKQRERVASPVSVLSLYLIDRDVESPVGPLAHRQGFIDAELGRCHRLALREGRQVEAELLPVGPRL